MAKSLLSGPFSHWHKAFDGFQTSTLDFYTAVEAGLGLRQIPGLAISRVTFHEGGAVSAKREYLRVVRKKLTFDVCAAPFGTGFFFSWWLAPRKPSRWLMLVFFLQIVLAIVISRPILQSIHAHAAYASGPLLYLEWLRLLRGVPFGIIVFLLLGLVLRPVLKAVDVEPGDPVLVTPIIGPIYGALANPVTYYHLDTILMYQSLVKGVVDEVVEGVTTAKGLRALTEDEKKPIMRDFLTR